VVATADGKVYSFGWGEGLVGGGREVRGWVEGALHFLMRFNHQSITHRHPLMRTRTRPRAPPTRQVRLPWGRQQGGPPRAHAD
jgi:hypothetical protein